MRSRVWGEMSFSAATRRFVTSHELARWGRRLSNLQPFGNAVQRALRAIALPGMPPKLPGLFTHSTSLAKAYLLRRALYLEDELDALLDESWISEGLERLATAVVPWQQLLRHCVQQPRPSMHRSLRSNRAGTCAISYFGIPTGRAWHMA